MLRGVSFESDHAGNFFPYLEKLMDVAKYEWYVDDVDLNYIEFRPGRYSGSEFKEALEELAGLSFARVRRYPVGSEVREMNAYEDYLQSDCSFLLLFYDGGYYQVYAKEEALTHRIYHLCAEMDQEFDHAEYVDDDNDERTRMFF